MATSSFAAPIYVPKFQGLTAAGLPLASGKLYTYLAGSSTPLATYPTYDDALAGTNANANPVVLDSSGQASVFGQATTPYKLVLKTSADVTLWTLDDVYVGVASAAAGSASEWVTDQIDNIPSSTTQFVVVGSDVTAIYHAGRRIRQVPLAGSTVYGTVTSSSFGSGNTTVNAVCDGASGLDLHTSNISYGIISYTNPAYLSPRSYVTVIKNGDQTDFNPVTKVTAWTEQVDTLGEFVTPTYTCKFPGYYLILFQCELADAGTDVAVTPQIYVSGVAVAQAAGRSDDTATEIHSVTVTHLASLAAGATVEAYVLGADATVVKGTTGTRLSIVRLV